MAKEDTASLPQELTEDFPYDDRRLGSSDIDRWRFPKMGGTPKISWVVIENTMKILYENG